MNPLANKSRGRAPMSALAQRREKEKKKKEQKQKPNLLHSHKSSKTQHTAVHWHLFRAGGFSLGTCRKQTQHSVSWQGLWCLHYLILNKKRKKRRKKRKEGGIRKKRKKKKAETNGNLMPSTQDPKSQSKSFSFFPEKKNKTKQNKNQCESS